VHRLYFLFKSMSKHLRTVREHFPVDAPPDAPAPVVPMSTTHTVTSLDKSDPSAESTATAPTEHPEA